jgi:ABC-2 type transport system permease protein
MLFIREIKRNYKSFLISGFVCVLLAMYMIAMSKSFGVDIQKMLDVKLPKEVQAALGLSGLDYSNPVSFFALSFSYIYLFISIYIAGIFAIIVSKEFSDKTAEYIFSLPVKRTRIILTKLSVVFLYAFSIVILVFLATWLSLSINVESGYNLQPLVLLSVAWLIGGLAFGSIAFLVSSFYTKTRIISSLAVGIVLGMYLLQIVISVNKNLDFLKYISPFDWFKGSDIVNSGEISIIYILIALGITTCNLFIGIRRFSKMDVLI